VERRARDRLGGRGVELTLREWVNSGLMTFFFFVLGLETRREFDLGDFREHRRLVLPLLASVGGMGAAVAIYLAFNLGSSAAQGWGVAMSTDTAFALGLLTLFGRRAPDRLRAFMLTVVIADELLARVVIALVYSDSIDVVPLIWAAGLFAVALVLLLGFKLRRGPAYFVLGTAMWVVALESHIEPLVVGLAFGLLAWATPAARSDLEHAGKRFREFREQPTPKLQHVARESIRTAISPNERLQRIYHPWTSYVIVPLFALANAGIAIDGDFLERAARSPITLGVLVGYVAGKPLSIVGTALLVTWLSRGRLRPTAGWAPSPAQARAPASASPSHCSSPRWPSTAHSSRRPRPASSPPPSARPPSRGSCSASSDCCRTGAVLPPCSAAQSRSSTSSSRSIPSRTTSAVRSTRR
jgi:Na+/H+ antiporter NhaA